MFRTILLGISLVVSPSLFCWVATEWDLQWMIGILLLTFSLTLVIAIWLFPLIPEHQVAVVFVREDQSFAKALAKAHADSSFSLSRTDCCSS